MKSDEQKLLEIQALSDWKASMKPPTSCTYSQTIECFAGLDTNQIREHVERSFRDLDATAVTVQVVAYFKPS